jgi:hypothetical protein
VGLGHVTRRILTMLSAMTLELLGLVLKVSFNQPLRIVAPLFSVIAVVVQGHVPFVQDVRQISWSLK